MDVEAAPPKSAAEIDREFDELDRLCSQGNEADHKLLTAALEEADREAKAWMRREMGLAK